MADKVVVAGGGGSRPPTSLLDNTVISRKKKKVVVTNCKAIVAGNNLELYEYSKPIYVGIKPKKKKELSPEEVLDILTNPEKYEEQKAKRRLEYKQRSRIKAVNNIRRLVQMNFERVGKFLTLTFADTDKFDIQSLSACLPKLQQFIKKLNAVFPGFRYLCVPEFQDKNNRGAVHYHLVLDIPFIDINKLKKLWRYGYLKINIAKNPLSIGLYMGKYLIKAYLDPRFDNHRRYYRSKNLIKPSVIYGNHLKNRIDLLNERGILPDYINEYESEWHGKVKYTSYNLTKHLPKKDKNDR